MATGRANRGILLLLAMMALVLSCERAGAKVQLSVEIGWSNRYRADKWTPLYVTLAESEPRDVTIEVYTPTDRRYAMQVAQRVTISPTPKTIALYVPLMAYRLDEATVTVRDAASGKRLEDFILSDYSSYAGSGMRGPEPVDANVLFVGISGSAGSERIVEGQLSHNTIKPCFIPPPRLPAVAIGYDGLDLLVLNQPDLTRMDTEQQRTIADWVRAGGSLVLWPGAEPMPAGGPIAEILPCAVGATQMYVADATEIARAGLPGRFAKLKGRAISNPTADAKPIRLLGAAEPWGYRRWVGYGQVMLVGVELSQLVFNNSSDAFEFWRGALGGVITLPETDANQPNTTFTGESRRTMPVQKTMNWIGDIPGAGSFGFSYVAGTLLALMLIVGPVDWFVLKWMGKQPWTWVTISGWIAVVTLGAIFIGHVLKAGDLYFRSASVIDEAGGVRAASTDFLGIYSPQTREYELITDPQGWWKPGSDGQSAGGGDSFSQEIDCHQDYRGNTPGAMSINVWNLRFLENTQLGPAAPIVEARLAHSADGKNVTGKITNRGAVALSGLQVRTGKGVARLAEPIAPGSTITVNAELNPKNVSLATMPVQEQRRRWQRYDPDDAGPATRPSQPLLAGLADSRAVQIDRILRDRGDVACIYADYDADPSDRVKLKEADEAKRSHIGLVRALVPLE